MVEVRAGANQDPEAEGRAAREAAIAFSLFTSSYTRPEVGAGETASDLIRAPGRVVVAAAVGNAVAMRSAGLE